MKISDHTIEEVNRHVDIVDVISDFISLKKSGSSYKALSPFTNEKTPSFFISPAKGIYKCFSSGKGGDAISFVMEHEGLSYLETIKYLAQKYGIAIETEGEDYDPTEKNKKESLLILLNFAKEHFTKNLHETQEGKSIGLTYFQERGYHPETLKKFEVGYAPDQWDNLLNTAVKKGYNEDLLEESGLIIKKEDKKYDRFRGRVIFPIHNLTGKAIAFGARILTSDKKQPKYINSPETEVYHKSFVLYGIHLAKQAIRNEDTCFLVEGYTDVMSLHQAGVENVVASSGTSLTQDQIKLIKRFTENVTVVFDGDAAGTKASLRGVDMLLEEGINVKAAVLPEGEDPDSYAKKLNAADLKHFLYQDAYDFIRFKTNLLLKDAGGDPTQISHTIHEVIQSISRMPDNIKRSLYIKEASRLLDIDEKPLYDELNKLLLKNYKEQQRKDNREQNKNQQPGPAEDTFLHEVEEKTQPTPTNALELQERETIRLLLQFGFEEMNEQYHYAEFVLEGLQDFTFKHPVYKKIFTKYLEALQKGQLLKAANLLADPDQEVKQAIADLMTTKHELSVNWKDKFDVYVPNETDSSIKDKSITAHIYRTRFHLVKALIKQNKEQLKEAESNKDDEGVMTYQKIHLELKKSEKELASKLGVKLM